MKAKTSSAVSVAAAVKADKQVAQTLSALARIGVEAIEHHQAEQGRKAAVENLRQAYRTYSQQLHGSDFIHKGTPEWQAMELACDVHYRALKAARANVYNARRRLANAIKRSGVSA